MNNYTSIYDLPILNFDKINQTGDLTWLLKERKNKLKVDKKHIETWSKIYDEYLNEFGVADIFKDYVMYMKEAIRLYNEAWNEGKRHCRTLAEIQVNKADELMKKSTSINLGELAGHMSKSFGQIDVSKISVYQFYYNLKIMSNGKDN